MLYFCLGESQQICNREVMVMEKKMSRRELLKVSAATGAILSMAPNISLAQEAKPIQLSKPQIGSGNSLMPLLWKRMSFTAIRPLFIFLILSFPCLILFPQEGISYQVNL